MAVFRLGADQLQSSMTGTPHQQPASLPQWQAGDDPWWPEMKQEGKMSWTLHHLPLPKFWYCVFLNKRLAWNKLYPSESGTMIKFLPLDFFGTSHRLTWKNKNGVYRLQISVLVSEIFNFGKCEKYANEITDDILHSTQFHIKYIYRAILANLQLRPMKFGRLIALQATHLNHFQFPPIWFHYVNDFQLKKH